MTGFCCYSPRGKVLPQESASGNNKQKNHITSPTLESLDPGLANNTSVKRYSLKAPILDSQLPLGKPCAQLRAQRTCARAQEEARTTREFYNRFSNRAEKQEKGETRNFSAASPPRATTPQGRQSRPRAFLVEKREREMTHARPDVQARFSF
jgi:hypothetical protein